MALNQNIESPLTLVTGSITSFTIPQGATPGPLLLIPSGSLPSFTASPWTSVISTATIPISAITQQEITQLKVTLANNTKYLIYAILQVASSATTNGTNVGASGSANTTFIFNVETPLTTTTSTIGINSTATTATFAGASLTNYYPAIIRAVVTTAAAGTAVFVPTVSTEGQGGNTSQVGPSVLYYRAF